MMMKEVEVGDEFVGKVVKTTTFGAFVELAKGTDGLLHISNVSPGERIASVEEVLNKGDEINVRVVEVDRERGPHRPAPRRRPGDRWQVGRGARHGRRRRRQAGSRTLAGLLPANNGRDGRGPAIVTARAGIVPPAPRGSGRPRHGSGRDRDRY